MATISASRAILFSHSSKFFLSPFKFKPASISFPLHLTKTRPFCSSSANLAHSAGEPQQQQEENRVILRRNVIEILEERGLLESITSDTLRGASSDPIAKPIKVYCGFDPTGESLHLGNLLGIIVLSWFRRCGHKAVALIGGATARVGDPSGKSLERPELDVNTLEKNTVSITNTIRRILSGDRNNMNRVDNYLDDSSLVNGLKIIWSKPSPL